jgi:hypothetical protein
VAEVDRLAEEGRLAQITEEARLAEQSRLAVQAPPTSLVMPLVPAGPPQEAPEIAPWNHESTYEESPSLMLSALMRDSSPTPVAVAQKNEWHEPEAEPEPDPEPEDAWRPGGSGMTDTAALLRELSGLFLNKDDPEPARTPSPPPRMAPPPAPKKKKGLFGR